MPKTKEKEKVRPVTELRLGRIKGTVWANETQNGTMFNVTISRLWRDGKQWKDSSSFGRDDLPLVAKVADMVHTWIFTQNQDQNGSHKSEQNDSDQNASPKEDF